MGIDACGCSVKLSYRRGGAGIYACGSSKRKSTIYLTNQSRLRPQGKFIDAINEGQKASIPQRYRAIVRKTITQSLVTEVAKPAYTLKRLEPTSEKPPEGLFVDEDE